MSLRTLAWLTAGTLFFSAAGAIGRCAEPVPSAAAYSSHSYVQHLVEIAVAAHPEIVELDIAATPPKTATSIVVASNAGRIGKPAERSDVAIVATGASTSAVNAAGDRFTVAQPLKDVSGETIGAMDVVFRHAKGTDTKSAERLAGELQSFFQKHVLSVANLADAYPYKPDFTADNAAQALVNKTMARRPELLVLGMHVTLPDGRGNVMLGSNIGRIGKAADEDDMRVVNTGKSNYEVAENGKRYEVELLLLDSAGRNVGALGTVFHYKAGDDKAALNALALQIRDEMARQIPTAAALLAKAN